VVAIVIAAAPVTGPTVARAPICEPPAAYEVPEPGNISRANRARLAPEVRAVAKRYGLEPALVDAVISAESGYDPAALSPAGAVGLMQLLPVTAAEYGVSDLCDPVANLEAGTRHLARLLRKYRNISHALAAYNAGEGAMGAHRRSITYLETRKYVIRVIKLYRQYRQAGAPSPSR
jgi:soluble lytic murein transglycosylase-like protein